MKEFRMSFERVLKEFWISFRESNGSPVNHFDLKMLELVPNDFQSMKSLEIEQDEKD